MSKLQRDNCQALPQENGAMLTTVRGRRLRSGEALPGHQGKVAVQAKLLMNVHIYM